MGKTTIVSQRDNFPAAISKKLAERAGYFCTNPLCNRFTIGPSDSDPVKSAKSGRAAHICAASPGGPRYDINQTPAQRMSITNGIWLCGACADMVDKNNGIDYPSHELIRWKNDHEKLIRQCLKGNWTVPLQLLKAESSISQCREILNFLEQKGALYMGIKHEVPYYVMDSIKDIRNYLTAFSSKILPGSPLEKMVTSINHACRYYMNVTGADDSMTHMHQKLGEMRKIIGGIVFQMEMTYKITAPPKLKAIMPKK